MEYTWKDQVKVVLGEITRKQQFDLMAELTADTLKDAPAWQQDEHLAALVAVYSTRRVLVLQDGVWQPTPALCEVDGEMLAIAKPELPEDFDNLPRSLADGWIKAAFATNDANLLQILSFPSASLMSMSAGNGKD